MERSGWQDFTLRHFGWSPAKAAANLRKHGIAFETAVRVFDDPLVVSDQDRVENGELRWRTLGVVDGTLLLVVAHTLDEDDRDEYIRIVSARPAEPRERRRYERHGLD